MVSVGSVELTCQLSLWRTHESNRCVGYAGGSEGLNLCGADLPPKSPPTHLAAGLNNTKIAKAKLQSDDLFSVFKRN